MNSKSYALQELSPKSLDFIAYPSTIDILEGTARSSKSTSALIKLGLRINSSNYNQFFISGATSTVVRRNLVDNQNGFLDLFKGFVKEGTETRKYGNHLIFIDSKKRKKIIYIFGFRDKARWINVLGSTLGGGLIDEINAAHQDFINEIHRAFSSMDDYWLGATLNPDNPDKEVYQSFINRTRPLKKWVYDIPFEIIKELKRIPADKTMKNAIYWHFNFNDNPIMTYDKIEAFKEKYPVDSFYYMSKIKGIRGVVEGVIFGKYLNDSFIAKVIDVNYMAQNQKMNEIEFNIKTNKYIRYSIGMDLGNNDIKKGTILTFSGVERGFKGVHPIDVYEAESSEANALVVEVCDKIISWHKMIRDDMLFDAVYIDGYGAVELLIPTIRKRLHALGYKHIKVELAIKFGDDGGRKVRMMLLLLLISQGKIKWNNTKGCKKSIEAVKRLVYADDGLPLDENQIEMDYYDSLCYSITPYTTKLNNEILELSR